MNTTFSGFARPQVISAKYTNPCKKCQSLLQHKQNSSFQVATECFTHQTLAYMNLLLFLTKQNWRTSNKIQSEFGVGIFLRSIVFFFSKSLKTPLSDALGKQQL